MTCTTRDFQTKKYSDIYRYKDKIPFRAKIIKQDKYFTLS
jgi:hypothetical protein